MARQKTTGNEVLSAPATVYAPPVAPPVQPRRVKSIERQSSGTVPVTRRWPQVRGGQCEFCGVMDKLQPAAHQYKMCPHYRGMDLVCSYCDPTKDPDEVNYHSILNVAEHPSNPDVLVVWCNQKACTDAHLKRFQVSKS